MREALCAELESLTSLQKCIILKQEGLNLYAGRKSGKMIYIPVKESSVFTQTLQTKKVCIVNDASKDRATVNEVREWIKMNEKVSNLMIIPVGENQGKHGGAILIILLNKFSFNDSGKQVFDNFSPSCVPACSKIF